MKHSLLLKAFTIGALMTSATVGTMAADMTANMSAGEISVTGQAVRQVAPSYALLNLGVSSKNTSVQSAKSQNELGAHFRPFEETLKNVIAWYKEHGYLS